MSETSENRSSRPSLWRRYLDFPLIWKLAIALVLGLVAGLVVGPPIAVIQPLGDIFLRLLMMLVVPMILLTLIAGVSSVSPKTMGRVGLKTFVFYIFTTIFAITIGISLALLVSPGAGLSVPADAEAEEAEEPPEMMEILIGIVPENIFEALTEADVLAVLFFAVIAGAALSIMKDSASDRIAESGMLIQRLVDGGVELIFILLRGVLQYSPIGVFALIAAVIGETGTDALVPLAALTGVVYGGIAIMIGVYVLILLVFRAPVGRFFREAKEPMITAYVTRSSNGTLPVTMRAAERLGIRKGVYSFTLPLGATINMDGTALYVGAATVFIANVSGTELTLTELAIVAIVGTLASIGTAGVPGAGLIMLTLAVGAVGLPMAPIALVAGIDAILDMARTMNNITGDLVGSRIIAKTEKGMLIDPDEAVRIEEGRSDSTNGAPRSQALEEDQALPEDDDPPHRVDETERP